MPKNAQIWPEIGIFARPCRLMWCPVGGLVGGCGARAVSRKTSIYFILYRPCRDLARELKFHRAVEKKNGTKQKNSLYWQHDINTLVETSGSPVEVIIKVRLTFIFFPVFLFLLQIQQRKGGKEKVYHCSKMAFTPDENDKGQGWCATKLNKRSKEEILENFFLLDLGHLAHAQIKSRVGACAARHAVRRERRSISRR